MPNKIAFVTGSSRGIGRGIAIQLAKDGYDVIVHYNQRKDKAQEVKQEIEKLGRKAHLIQSDLNRESEIAKIAEKLNQITDKLDLLVNNAGINIWGWIEEQPLEEINKVIQLVLTQKIRLSQICLPLLRKGSSPNIVNITSRLGLMPNSEDSIYCTSQAGLIMFTKVCALEYIALPKQNPNFGG